MCVGIHMCAHMIMFTVMCEHGVYVLSGPYMYVCTTHITLSHSTPC